MVLASLAIAVLSGCDRPEDPCALVTVFQDDDGDGFGAGPGSQVCELQSGASTLAGDCDDTNPDIAPGRPELCDGIDNNCDGSTDEGLPTGPYYQDQDGDGFGDDATLLVACRSPWTQPAFIGGDCDDESAAIHPQATERCDQVDNDCDGRIDDNDDDVLASDLVQSWQDNDQDGFGANGAGLASCAVPPGNVLVSGDCDDLDDDFNPLATEFCDGVDNDCDGHIDDEGRQCDHVANMAIDDLREFPCDCDGDGFGDAIARCLACRVQPGVAAANPNDCDDQDAWANVPQSWVSDGDGDLVGAGPPQFTTCLNPNLSEDPPNPAVVPASFGDDCNDANSGIYPGATEICNDGIDQDCSGADC